MNSVSQHLLETLDRTLPLLRQITDAAATVKSRPDQWSKKEILGHLIDSAGNNQQKFVRTMQATGRVAFVGYYQNAWVEAQHYNEANWLQVIALWESFNRHLAHVIEHTPEDKLGNTISIDGSEPFTLGFIMTDYVEHLKHHLKQILPDVGLESNFENLY